MVLAGLTLDAVKVWPFYQAVPETIVLIPALLGLKGNVQMTLASRLSTQANTGKIAGRARIWAIITSNIGLIQTQSVVVTFAASIAATVIYWVGHGRVDATNLALLCASSLTTASLTSFAIGLLMIIVILVAMHFRVNPDNVATPIAAALGDLTNIIVLSYVGMWYYKAHLTAFWINIIICVILLVTVPIFAYAAYQDPATRVLLKSGWTPILISMLISSGGGTILENAMHSFEEMALFGPVINGVGGNLVAVHASRISTFYHKTSPSLGLLPEKWTLLRFLSPFRAFFSREWDARSARVLLFLVIPGHLVFNFAIGLLRTGENPPSSVIFTICYVTAAVAQVILLLYVCQLLVAFMWSKSIDPDNAAIPYMTALGDLLGSGFLYLALLFLKTIKEV
ncbi:divalent cation transporter [Aphelenchoides avenae]|nr:divalent cation transporter [Aphelenchus avenae]